LTGHCTQSKLSMSVVLACGSGSVVEHLLAKEKVASSNLVFRSRKALLRAFFRVRLADMRNQPGDSCAEMAEWQTLRS
jgi:hypothetical protein